MHFSIWPAVLGTPHFHALCLILVSTAAIQALLAVWAASSRVHWFWRALAVWAGVAVLLPIRAYQPALVFAISSPLIVGACVLHRKSQSNGRTTLASQARLRFTLQDLLLLTALAGLILSSLLHLLPRLGKLHFAEFAVTTAFQTIVPPLAWASFEYKYQQISRAALLVALIGFTGAFYAIRRSIGTEWAIVGILFESWMGAYSDLRAIGFALSEFTLLLLSAVAVARTPCHLKAHRKFDRPLEKP